MTPKQPTRKIVDYRVLQNSDNYFIENQSIWFVNKSQNLCYEAVIIFGDEPFFIFLK